MKTVIQSFYTLILLAVSFKIILYFLSNILHNHIFIKITFLRNRNQDIWLVRLLSHDHAENGGKDHFKLGIWGNITSQLNKKQNKIFWYNYCNLPQWIPLTGQISVPNWLFPFNLTSEHLSIKDSISQSQGCPQSRYCICLCHIPSLQFGANLPDLYCWWS
jgi:hypothetical protein